MCFFKKNITKYLFLNKNRYICNQNNNNHSIIERYKPIFNLIKIKER